MKFTEFCNRNKNVMQSSTAKRITDSIEVTEERDAFYNGNLFKKFDMVEEKGIPYRILEQCSNYYQVVDESGNLFRKFPKQLIKTESVFVRIPGFFHGYRVTSETGMKLLESIDHDNCDNVGTLKQLKEADKMESQFKSKDKLTVAKIIADAIGIPHDSISDPSNLVNAAIRKAKKDPALMKNKAILQNMLQIAKEVGIKYSDTAFDVNESTLNGGKVTHEVTVDHHGSNQQVPLYTKTYKVSAKSDEDASNQIKKLVGGRNHRVKSLQQKVAESEVIRKGADGRTMISAALLIGKAREFAKKDHDPKKHGNKLIVTPEHKAMARKHLMGESFEVNELNTNTLKTYSALAKKHAVKLAASGSKAKNPETANAKLNKAGKRLDGAAKADKKAFGNEWKKRIGMSEEVAFDTATNTKQERQTGEKPIILKDLLAKLRKAGPDNSDLNNDGIDDHVEMLQKRSAKKMQVAGVQDA